MMSLTMKLAMVDLHEAGRPRSARQLGAALATMRALSEKEFVRCTGGSTTDAVWEIAPAGRAWLTEQGFEVVAA